MQDGVCNPVRDVSDRYGTQDLTLPPRRGGGGCKPRPAQAVINVTPAARGTGLQTPSGTSPDARRDLDGDLDGRRELPRPAQDGIGS
jgi:hypothetical protein